MARIHIVLTNQSQNLRKFNKTFVLFKMVMDECNWLKTFFLPFLCP